MPQILNSHKTSWPGSISRLALLILLCVTTSCNEDDEACDDSLIATESLEGLYGCSDTTFDLELPVVNDFVIISSQDEYESLVTGLCQPEIDFATFDLIIGRHQLNRGLEAISYFYSRACPTVRYELRVVFTLDDELVSPTVAYHVLVPKIPAGHAVDVRTETN